MLIDEVMLDKIKAKFWKVKNMALNLKIAISAAMLTTIAGASVAENRVFNFLSPTRGGNPQTGTYLFGVAQAQLGATNRDPLVAGVGGGTTTANGGNISGPTIVIPINTNIPTPVVQTPTPNVGTEATAPQVN